MICEPRLRLTDKSSGPRFAIIRECQEAWLAPAADINALADRFTAMMDGRALQVLASTSDMTVDRMRELLLDSFEPDFSLRG